MLKKTLGSKIQGDFQACFSLHCYLLIKILIISGSSHLWRQWPWTSGLRSCYLPAEMRDKPVSFPVHIWRMCLAALGGSREALKQLKSSWFDVVQTQRLSASGLRHINKQLWGNGSTVASLQLGVRTGLCPLQAASGLPSCGYLQSH